MSKTYIVTVRDDSNRVVIACDKVRARCKREAIAIIRYYIEQTYHYSGYIYLAKRYKEKKQ